MNPLPADDLPSVFPERIDGWLRHQLDQVTEHYFYQLCDPDTQNLLSLCNWYLTTRGKGLTLVIHCPNSQVNWRVLDYMGNLAQLLEPLASSARIRVHPPFGEGDPIEMRVDEQTIYHPD
ncbi:MAG: hypothetical protein AB4058_20880 [Microcystaceae cyanobacterium]